MVVENFCASSRHTSNFAMVSSNFQYMVFFTTDDCNKSLFYKFYIYKTLVTIRRKKYLLSSNLKVNLNSNDTVTEQPRLGGLSKDLLIIMGKGAWNIEHPVQSHNEKTFQWWRIHHVPREVFPMNNISLLKKIKSLLCQNEASFNATYICWPLSSPCGSMRSESLCHLCSCLWSDHLQNVQRSSPFYVILNIITEQITSMLSEYYLGIKAYLQ